MLFYKCGPPLLSPRSVFTVGALGPGSRFVLSLPLRVRLYGSPSLTAIGPFRAGRSFLFFFLNGKDSCCTLEAVFLLVKFPDRFPEMRVLFFLSASLCKSFPPEIAECPPHTIEQHTRQCVLLSSSTSLFVLQRRPRISVKRCFSSLRVVSLCAILRRLR